MFLFSSFSQLIKQIQTKNLSKSFAQLLYLATRSQLNFDRSSCSVSHCEYQQRTVLLLTNVPDLSMKKEICRYSICHFSFFVVSVAVNWNISQCTTSDVEDLVSTIDPFVYLREVDQKKQLYERIIIFFL